MRPRHLLWAAQALMPGRWCRYNSDLLQGVGLVTMGSQASCTLPVGASALSTSCCAVCHVKSMALLCTSCDVEDWCDPEACCPILYGISSSSLLILHAVAGHKQYQQLEGR